jgi:16S rRNA (guanine966-N2)-methyltransferase
MVFDVIKDVQGAVFLDIFAGTGAMGIEAVSRGAVDAVFVEARADYVKLLRQNLAQLGIGDRCKIVQQKILGLSDLHLNRMGFTVAFIDPPYTLFPIPDLHTLSLYLQDRGLLVYEYRSSHRCNRIEGFEFIKSYSGGDSRFSFFCKTSE